MDHEQFVVRPRVRCELAQVPQLSLRSRKGERAGCGSRVDRVRFGRWARIASSDKRLEERAAPTFHTTARACGGWRACQHAALSATTAEPPRSRSRRTAAFLVVWSRIAKCSS